MTYSMQTRYLYQFCEIHEHKTPVIQVKSLPVMLTFSIYLFIFCIVILKKTKKFFSVVNRLGTTPLMRDNPSFMFQSMFKWWPTFNIKMTKFWISTYFYSKGLNIGYLKQLLVEQFLLFHIFKKFPFHRK